jgi:hypothetical protein
MIRKKMILGLMEDGHLHDTLLQDVNAQPLSESLAPGNHSFPLHIPLNHNVMRDGTTLLDHAIIIDFKAVFEDLFEDPDPAIDLFTSNDINMILMPSNNAVYVAANAPVCVDESFDFSTLTLPTWLVETNPTYGAPTRSLALGGIQYDMNVGTPLFAMTHNITNIEAVGGDNFEVELTASTVGVNSGVDDTRGQVDVYMFVSMSDGTYQRIGIRHNSAGAGLHGFYHRDNINDYVLDTPSQDDVASQVWKIVRDGSDLKVYRGGTLLDTRTIGTGATVSEAAIVSATTGGVTRLTDWTAIYENLTTRICAEVIPPVSFGFDTLTTPSWMSISPGGETLSVKTLVDGNENTHYAGGFGQDWRYNDHQYDVLVGSAGDFATELILSTDIIDGVHTNFTITFSDGKSVRLEYRIVTHVNDPGQGLYFAIDGVKTFISDPGQLASTKWKIVRAGTTISLLVNDTVVGTTTIAANATVTAHSSWIGNSHNNPTSPAGHVVYENLTITPVGAGGGGSQPCDLQLPYILEEWTDNLYITADNNNFAAITGINGLVIGDDSIDLNVEFLIGRITGDHEVPALVRNARATLMEVSHEHLCHLPDRDPKELVGTL